MVGTGGGGVLALAGEEAAAVDAGVRVGVELGLAWGECWNWGGVGGGR